jgi:hypothetical protein
MSVSAPVTIVTPFGVNAADPQYITLPVPVASQTGVTPGAASFEDGFPPLTMSDPATEGGVPPFGQDMNGILRMVTSYLAWLQGGGGFYWDAAFVAANTGYAVGSLLRSATVPGKFWYNTVANNPNDPDSDPTDWIGYSILASPVNTLTATTLAGLQDNLNVTGIGFVRLNTAAGAITYNGFLQGFTGQMVTVTNLGSANVTFTANSGSSPANERFRLPSNVTITTNMSYTFRYNGSEWVPA